jgi:phage-related protein
VQSVGRNSGFLRIAPYGLCAATGKRIVVVRVFIKKTQKTPRHEIKLSLERAKEILK